MPLSLRLTFCGIEREEQFAAGVPNSPLLPITKGEDIGCIIMVQETPVEAPNLSIAHKDEINVFPLQAEDSEDFLKRAAYPPRGNFL